MDVSQQEVPKHEVDLLRQEIRKKINACYMKMRAKRPIGFSLDDVNNLIDQLIECDSVLDDINSPDHYEFSTKFFDKIMQVQSYLSGEDETSAKKMAPIPLNSVSTIILKAPVGQTGLIQEQQQPPAHVTKIVNYPSTSSQGIDQLKLTPASTYVNEETVVNYTYEPMSLEEQAASLGLETKIRRENKLRLNVISEYIVNGDFVAGLVVFPKEWETFITSETTIAVFYSQMRKIAHWIHKFLDEIYENPTPLVAIRTIIQVWIAKHPDFHYRYLILKQKCQEEERLGKYNNVVCTNRKNLRDFKPLPVYYRSETIGILLFRLILNIRNTADKVTKRKGDYNYIRPNNIKRRIKTEHIDHNFAKDISQQCN